MMRTNYCGELTVKNENTRVSLCGWVHSRRDHGGVIFIDLRDVKGIVQTVFNPGSDIFASAENLKPESVVRIEGAVRMRPEGTRNSKINTGDIEVVAESAEVLNECAPLPFSISDYAEVSEEVRLKYRYLDMRRTSVKDTFIFRSRLSGVLSEFLRRDGFCEVETPFLTKSTPEGARDFLVPSRLTPGAFYALPQSPQLFKQLLMVAGFDRYFQLARCFRDEDLRADRQPEFTQLDLEMSFVEEKDVRDVIERLLAEVFEKLLNHKIALPIPSISYSEAMLKYGSDKPDLRFGMPIADLTGELSSSGFKVFRQAVEKGSVVRALRIPCAAAFSRAEIDGLIAKSVEFGAGGLAWMKKTSSGFESNIVKFFAPAELDSISSKTEAVDGDLVVFVAGSPKIAAFILGQLRLLMAERLKVKREGYNFVWITDFPLLEKDETDGGWAAMHHPFTSPADTAGFLEDKIPVEKLRARAYDIVLNGTELGGGSIRIHSPSVQRKIFALLGISDDDARRKFGFLLDALNYGAPPHGGIALGIDRLAAIMLGENSIREVIAFPKTQRGSCPLTGAPADVSEKQLREIYIKTTVSKEKEK
ncbi:MAG: aspartate--tRNA ligase [Elusimicrobia bacterium HGW-Elusimicrobia-1]|jgi:aspartyl-tRNA synthetase|nr:MAG: aspartate--tRNA ligase [Elusimicrobia bacterium HGW-Elusimicrobia-1]